VIAAIDPADLHHPEAVAKITASREARRAIKISAVSVAELASIKGSGRKARLEWTSRFIEALGDEGVIDLDRATAEAAGAIRNRRSSLQLADALIKASADSVSGELLTADRRLAKLDGVTLIG
jgi:predicted nucleic acid-binding protein